MNIIITAFHIIACIGLIAIVLLQTGKGAEMGAAFGGASQTLFGGSGGTSFMGKLTTGVAVVFMVTCLLLSYRPSTPGSRSVMTEIPVEQAQPQGPPPPVLPEARPVQPEQPAAAAPEQPKAQEQTAPAQQPEKAPAAKAQPEPQKQDKAPAKKQ